MDLVGDWMPVATAEDAYAGLLVAQEHLFSLGVTGWQDAMIGTFPGNPDNFDVYRRAARSGDLRARVGRPPGKTSMDQPPPLIHAAAGWARA